MPPRTVRPPDRPDLYVVARFLDRLREPHVTWTKSRLQHAVRVNYDIFRAYLVLLEEKGFIEELAPEDTDNAKGSPVVRLTAEGHRAHRRLVAWIREVFGDTRL